MSKMQKTVICDLDGTLADINHRLHYLEKKDWDGFFGAVADDTPQEWCVQLVRSLLNAQINVVFVSGRNETAREATEKWLNDLGFGHLRLIMRPEKDRRPDYEFKNQVYLERFVDDDILFVIEDRKQVVDMWRSHGLTVLHCEEGEF